MAAPASRTSMSPPASSASPNLSPRKWPAPIEHLGAREILPRDLPLPAAEDRSTRASSALRVEEWVFTPDYADRSLRDHFKLLTLDGCGLANRRRRWARPAPFLHYLRETQRASLDHIDRPAYYNRADSMVLDASRCEIWNWGTLFAADAGGTQPQATVLAALDPDPYRNGGRLLRQRLLRPSMERAKSSSVSTLWASCWAQTILRAEAAQGTRRYSGPRSASLPKSRWNRRPARRFWRWGARSKRFPR